MVGFTVGITSAFFSLQYVVRLVGQLGLNGSMARMIIIGYAAALPELSTVIELIRRENPYLALGTLIGSNMVNPLVGIGSGAMILSYFVPGSLLIWDLPFTFTLGVVFLMWLYFYKQFQAGLREGFFLLIAYFVYLFLRRMVFV